MLLAEIVWVPNHHEYWPTVARITRPEGTYQVFKRKPGTEGSHPRNARYAFGVPDQPGRPTTGSIFCEDDLELQCLLYHYLGGNDEPE